MSETASANDRLDSWKEIAKYLKRTERTVSRWQDRGLPVYRVPGGKKQAVFAYKHELDAWLKEGTIGQPTPEQGPGAETEVEGIQSRNESATFPTPQNWARKHFIFLLITTSAVAAAVLGLTFRVRSSHAPLAAKMGFSSSGVQAFDDAGRLIWTHTFPQMLAVESEGDVQGLTKQIRFVDFKGDGQREILVKLPVRMGPNPTDGVQDEVDCFSNTGELLWAYAAQEKFKFGKYVLEGPWIVNDIFVSTQGKKPIIWVALDHNRWGNSFVVQLDPATGKDTVRFVNTGTLYKLNEIRISGVPYLLVAGFNNEYAAGSLAVIDETRPYAVSPQTEGTRHRCTSCGEGSPDYYFVFPRSEINLLSNLWEDSVQFISVHGEEIDIEKTEFTEAEKVHTVYVFHTEPTIAPFSLRFDSWYDLMHRELEKTHKLDHSLETCPERLHPKPVKMWTPSRGWQQIDLPPVRAVD